MKKVLALVLSMVMAIFAFGCAKDEGVDAPSDKQVKLVVAGAWPECTAIDLMAKEFNEKYPNCQIEYEYVQDFGNNITKRLESKTDKIDLLITDNIQLDSPLLPYTLDFSTVSDKIDFSKSFKGLIDNFKLQSNDENEKNKIYAVPLGAEIRGMYVNKTLLNKYGLKVPTNRDELLNACKVLKKEGLVPIQGNPGMFGTQLLYPYICNTIANAEDYDKAYKEVSEHKAGISEKFRDPAQFLYTLVENKYYDYKYCETELNLFNDTSNEGYARSFLNILDDGEGNYTKKDDVGQFAFMPSCQSITSVIEKTKEDYHSDIDYEFILSPVSDDSGYAYISPGKAMAVNKSGDNLDWTLKFLSFIMEEDNNTKMCDEMGYIPNISNAYDVVKEKFNIPENNISHLGEVTFDYSFYSIIDETLIEIAKANNPKYMNTENGKTEMYPFDYYMKNFEGRFQAIK